MTGVNYPSLILDRIKQDGWWQDKGNNKDGKGNCIITAMPVVDFTREDRHRAFEFIARQIELKFPSSATRIGKTGSDLIIRWNDEPERKLAHVRRVLQAAAKEWDRAGPA